MDMGDKGGLFGTLLLGAIALLFIVNILPSMIASVASAATTSGITSSAQSTVQLNQVLIAFVPMGVVAAIIFKVWKD